MTDRPILFSGPMIRALLAGRKTQTRRMLTRVRTCASPDAPAFTVSGADLDRALLNASDFRCVDGDIWSWKAEAFDYQAPAYETHWLARLPFAAGDRLWVRETWSHTGDGVFEIRQARIAPTGRVIYAATPAPDAPHAKYWPSIHMPREFSRLTLAVTAVRIERLADLTEENALAEGVCVFTEGLDRGAPWGDMAPADRALMVRNTYGSAAAAYRHLWETINGADSWELNPWVVALTFDVHRANIATLDKVAA